MQEDFENIALQFQSIKVWEATYLPFGGVVATCGSPTNIRFPGQWFQSESGLHQNWMRDYDPTTGRYMQADPLGLVDGASVYGYVGQNPGRYVDPRGLYTIYDAIDSLIEKTGDNTWPYSFDENDIFEEWLDLEIFDADWIVEITPCPCKLIDAGQDWSAPAAVNQNFHPGGAWGIRSLFESPGGHGAQCIYDVQGSLITSSPAAGSADFRSPAGISFDTLAHYRHDVEPYELARRLGRIDDYFLARPEVSSCCGN